ncbi:DUF1793-domain-containing protein [Wolfiporia cocos MD-104 SS10]|uniref:DUF1793-domain-containing protein n=1 Tax=Wolfiporia cocos (strain MD-104) TaxID=742152 RepID=A0A2H3JQN9_WOLCO|nr:DUF1793-domain-containing protein [Wolfiporia cocos MD-104 SS10]
MQGLSALLLLAAAIPTSNAAVTWTATPFNPAAVPLAVRSPYLSAWLPQGSGAALNAGWPNFWTGTILGWAGFINVDGTSYNFLGVPSVPSTTFTKAVQTDLTITSTQSTFSMTAGPVDLTVQFLSPIEPGDLVNLSLPFSYVALTAVPNDGKSHSVQLYTDISGEWLSADDSMTINWTTTTTGNVITHISQLENQTLFGDINNRMQQGASYYSVLNTPGTTYQVGQDIVVRAQFINHSTLTNTSDTNFRGISDDWPVFAFAHDLGNISSLSEPVVISIGFARDPAVEYITAGGAVQHRSSYFWSRYATIDDAIATFLGDYSNAVMRAKAFDTKVLTDSSQSSMPINYHSIVLLSIRQAFGGIEITISKDSNGSYNTSDVTAFLKEISSSGYISTVDNIFSAWPLFLYTNPLIGKALLLPLLEYQAAGLYSNKWACHDLGPQYPKATGYPNGNDTDMPVEESGNMLIMTLSYTQWSNDTSLIHSYYNLLNQWAQYLQANTLAPSLQLDSDAIAGPLANQTNLAIKGIIGIKAMSEMSFTNGDNTAGSSYNTTAYQYVEKWQSLAMAPGGLHLTLAYGNDSSWGLTYNMYADKLLNTNIIPESVYNLQTSWYKEKSGDLQWGIPLDTRHSYTFTGLLRSRRTLQLEANRHTAGWEIWTAATVTDTSLQTAMVNMVNTYASGQQNNEPFGDWYDTTDGDTECSSSVCFKARPVVGAHLALLTLSPSNISTGPSSNTSGPGSGGNNGSGGGNSTTPASKSSSASPIQAARWLLGFTAATCFAALSSA